MEKYIKIAPPPFSAMKLLMLSTLCLLGCLNASVLRAGSEVNLQQNDELDSQSKHGPVGAMGHVGIERRHVLTPVVYRKIHRVQRVV